MGKVRCKESKKKKKKFAHLTPSTNNLVFIFTIVVYLYTWIHPRNKDFGLGLLQDTKTK